MGRGIGRTVYDVKGLTGIGKGDDQRSIAPLVVIGDVHTLFALTVRGTDGTIRIDDGLFTKRLGLLLPDTASNRVLDFHELGNLVFIKTAKEKGIETAYAVGAVTVSELFEPYTKEDLEKNRYPLALRNVNNISSALKRQAESLERQLKQGPETWRTVFHA